MFISAIRSLLHSQEQLQFTCYLAFSFLFWGAQDQSLAVHSDTEATGHSHRYEQCSKQEQHFDIVVERRSEPSLVLILWDASSVSSSGTPPTPFDLISAPTKGTLVVAPALPAGSHRHSTKVAP